MGSENVDNKKLEAEIQFYGISLDEVKKERKYFLDSSAIHESSVILYLGEEVYWSYRVSCITISLVLIKFFNFSQAKLRKG